MTDFFTKDDHFIPIEGDEDALVFQATHRRSKVVEVTAADNVIVLDINGLDPIRVVGRVQISETLISRPGGAVVISPTSINMIAVRLIQIDDWQL